MFGNSFIPGIWLLPVMFEVGVVGAGYVSKNIHVPLLKSMDDTNVGFVSDIDKRSAKNLGEIYSVPSVHIEDVSMLPRCDVILLAIPMETRTEYIEEFSARGTPIFCEKPFARDLGTHNRFIEISQYISCNYQRRFYNNIIQLKKIFESGVLGDVESAQFYETHSGSTGISRDSYRLNKSISGGGILIEKGCHSLSQIDAIFPKADVRLANADVTYINGFDTDVRADLEIHHDRGSFNMEFRLSRNRNLSKKLNLTFDKCRVLFDPTEPGDPLRVQSCQSENNIELEFRQNSVNPQSYNTAIYKSWRNFLEGIIDDDTEELVRNTSKMTTRLIEEIYDDYGGEKNGWN